MKYFAFILLFLNIAVYAQEGKVPSDLFAPANVKKFADHLFCSRDYLRAVDEYKRYLASVQDDSLQFKIGIAYSRMEMYSLAALQFRSVNYPSLSSISKLEYFKSLFQAGDYPGFRDSYSNLDAGSSSKYSKNIDKLYNLTFMFTGNELPAENKFLYPFDENEIGKIRDFYKWKLDPPYKNPAAAAVLSAILPGAGKIYTEQYGDGILAFLSTGVLGYIAYTDFKAGHNLRGWIFSAAAAGFYAGNIYGSAASAQIYNARISFDFRNGVKLFLENNNYYAPRINYCGDR